MKETKEEIKLNISALTSIPISSIHNEILIAAYTDVSSRAAPLFVGLSGAGKTAMVHKTAKTLGAYVLDVNCTALNGGDIPGIPDLSDEKKWDVYAHQLNDGIPLVREEKIAVFRLQKALWLCTDQYEEVERNRRLVHLAQQGLQGTEAWEETMAWKASPVILFLDDFHKASPSVARAINALLDDRRKLGAFGEFNLRENVQVVLAANSQEHGVRVNPSESDVASRVMKYNVTTVPEEVLTYMRSQGFRPEVLDFLQKNPAFINPMEREEFREILLLDTNFPSSRSWARLNADLNAREAQGSLQDDRRLRATIHSLIGTYIGNAFFDFLKEGISRSLSVQEVGNVQRIGVDDIVDEIVISANTDPRNRAAPYFVGAPGSGKTSLIHAAALQIGGYVLDVNCTALNGGDIPGIPDLADEESFVVKSPEFAQLVRKVQEDLGGEELDLEEKIAIFRLQKAMWQCTSQYEVVERERRLYKLRASGVAETSQTYKDALQWKAPPVILFLDDFHKANGSVSRAINAMLDDRRKLGAFGEFNLRDNVLVALAGNAEEHGVRVNPSESDILNRVKKYRVHVNPDQYIQYMEKRACRPSIIAFLREHPYFVSPMDEPAYRDAVKRDSNFPCPRNWSRLNSHLLARDQMGLNDHQQRKAGIQAILGTGIGNMYALFEIENKISLPPLSELIDNPDMVVPYINDQSVMIGLKEQMFSHARKGRREMEEVLEIARKLNKQDYKFFCLRLGNYTAGDEGKVTLRLAAQPPMISEIFEALKEGNNVLEHTDGSKRDTSAAPSRKVI